MDCVLSGSMAPELNTGSLVITRPVEPDAVEVGDIITFYNNSEKQYLITHRVIKVWNNSPVYFQTKGDACESPDPFPVQARNLVGKVGFSLPYAGFIIYFLKTPAGFVASVVVPTIILVMLYVRGILTELKKHRAQKQVG